jgi:uncharacterized protein (TIGR03032 family)
MNPPAPNAATPPQIELRAHGDFVEWLAASGGTLGVTTYNSGKLALFSAPGGRLESRIWRLPRPMGLAFGEGRFAVATRERIFEWARPAGDARSTCSDADAWELAAVHETGRLDAHELAYDSRGLCFANTRFNCIGRPSVRARFRRDWTPGFITERIPQDCCHLNGLGIRGGRVAMVTAFCEGGDPGAWRASNRFESGVVIDVKAGRAVVRGLCMPHSPRWDGRRWWLCNSGEGALCTFRPTTGECRAVASLPGFTRGLCFAAGRAVVGLSRIRKRHILDAPPVRERFGEHHSGVGLVEPRTGRITGALEFCRGGREVFDLTLLRNAERTRVELSQPA